MSDLGVPWAGAKTQIRPGGGFRQSFGSGLSDEYEESGTTAAAVTQKQVAQQASVLGQTGAAKQQTPTDNQSKEVTSEFAKYQSQPRNVVNLKEELIVRPIKDIATTFKSFFDLNLLLNINQKDSPDKQAKKKKIASNWQQLTAEEQAYVKQKYQEEQQKKQQELQEEQRKKEEEARLADEVSITPPSSPKRGPIELSGSKKQQTSELLKNRREQLVQVDS